MPTSPLLLGLLVACSGWPFANPEPPALPPPSPPPPAVERAASPAWMSVEKTRRHAILIVVDTLRQDALLQADTPVLDALAASGSVGRAWSASTWTAPAMVSMFSGLPVRSHGWDFPFPRFMDEAREGYPPLPDVPLLAEVMTEAGFISHGVVANPFLRQGLGFERGFQRWRISDDAALPGLVGELVQAWDPSARHFLYVHFFGPHHPLAPTQATARRHKLKNRYRGPEGDFPIGLAEKGDQKARDNYREAYRAVVEDTDARIGELLATLGPIAEDAVIVVTSDHGELLGEHGQWGHDRWVWEPLTHVPFIAKGAGPVPETLVTTAVPAILTTATGVDATWPVTGLDPLPLVSQRTGKLALSPDGRLKGVWDPESVGGDGFTVFELDADPWETNPRPLLRLQLRDARLAWEAGTPAHTLKGTAGTMTGETREMLEQLGYLDDEPVGADVPVSAPPNPASP